MSMDQAFDKLVRDLDDAALSGLNEAAAREAAQRRQANAFKLEDIKPNMSEADKLRATEEIARALRGDQ